MSGIQVRRLCPVCQKEGFRELFKKATLTLVRCCECATVYTNPIEEDWATGLNYDKLAVPYYLSPNKVESDYAPVRFARELKLFRTFCQQGRVLDVGCSTGAFLFQLNARFPGDYQTLGVDVAGPALDYAAQKGVPILRESFLTHNFQQDRFSAVTFWAVLEHLADPGAFLVKAASLLKSGGVCFILVPNFRSLAVRLLGAKYRYIFPQHINYFTLQTLKRLTANAPELQVIYSSSMHFNPIVIWQDRKSTGEFVSDEERGRLLKRTTGYKQNPILRPVKLALAAAERALAWLNLSDNIVLVLQKRG